ncbi:MAG: bifunctional [glutamate--ammonia ligase]-adenylyl-L-tyrosine phosphorylase/[glutamate--ammonia-ligase] adenylyltransferase [Polyangiaceae bacterium]
MRKPLSPRLLELADRVDPVRARGLASDLAARYGSDSDALAAAVLLATCYPALTSLVERDPLVASHALRDRERERTHEELRALADAAVAAPDLSAEEAETRVRRGLRRFARAERARIALREILPRKLGGADVDSAARELSLLAEVTIDIALEEAFAWARRRFGEPRDPSGAPSRFVVLGMGKLGGEELNPGSDIDLIYFYDVDEGTVTPVGAPPDAAPSSTTVGEFWRRVARRLTATLEDVTEDGQVWRVDLRLRPDGSAGALALSLAAAERYYESFGRLWERAALLRARPVGGSRELGWQLLDVLAPFVWRRRVDPSIAVELVHLVRRARAELSDDPETDLKLGPGGIREAEFFVQTLQLVWGGRDASLRARPTPVALARLASKGLCTHREASDIHDAYYFLRRAEHVVQVASGVQTHSLPRDGEGRERVARVLGFDSFRSFSAALANHRERVERRLTALLPEGEVPVSRWAALLGALEAGELAPVVESLGQTSPSAVASDEQRHVLARALLDLSGHPDGVLSERTRESFPGLADTLLDALFDAADPSQAARYLRVFFSRVKQPAVYVRLLYADPAALRRLVTLLGASAFVGDTLSNNPELGDVILFQREVITPEAARREVMAAGEIPARPDEDPDEALVGALRIAKTRLTLETVLGDLSDALTVSQVNEVLTAVADASLEVAARRATHAGSESGRGFAVIAMGKLGGREISYGSDLDVLFVYDAACAPDPTEATGYFTRVARRVIRYISTVHGAGPGYELDTRLRPSGNQGLLVTSLEAFARYHGVAHEPSTAGAVGGRSAIWERMALVRSRFAAGDAELGARFIGLARAAAFGEVVDAPAAAREIRRIRERVERESSAERLGAYDIKLGKGALLDIEFIAQFLQVVHGARLGEDARVARTQDSLEALARAGVLGVHEKRALVEAYAFLRRLELRVRVARGDADHVLDTRTAALTPVARRVGLRDHGLHTAADTLHARYRDTTSTVRALFDEIFPAG